MERSGGNCSKKSGVRKMERGQLVFVFWQSLVPTRRTLTMMIRWCPGVTGWCEKSLHPGTTLTPNPNPNPNLKSMYEWVRPNSWGIIIKIIWVMFQSQKIHWHLNGTMKCTRWEEWKAVWKNNKRLAVMKVSEQGKHQHLREKNHQITLFYSWHKYPWKEQITSDQIRFVEGRKKSS